MKMTGRCIFATDNTTVQGLISACDPQRTFHFALQMSALGEIVDLKQGKANIRLCRAETMFTCLIFFRSLKCYNQRAICYVSFATDLPCHGCTGGGDGANGMGPPGEILGGFSFCSKPSA
jgi:hypothetical protein